MYEPRILHRGPLPPQTLTITTERWRSHPDYDAEVEAIWNGQVQAAATRGHRLWDGRHYRLFSEDDVAAPALRLGTVSFRYLATFKALHERHRALGLAPFHHISTAGLLTTADGLYVFGKRALNGRIDLIGGGFQPEDGVVPDFEANLRKEIHEELGVGADGLREIRGIGTVLSTISNVLIISRATLHLSRAELLTAFDGREEDEMAELVFVPESEIAAYLRGLTDYRTLLPDLL